MLHLRANDSWKNLRIKAYSHLHGIYTKIAYWSLPAPVESAYVKISTKRIRAADRVSRVLINGQVEHNLF